MFVAPPARAVMVKNRGRHFAGCGISRRETLLEMTSGNAVATTTPVPGSLSNFRSPERPAAEMDHATVRDAAHTLPVHEVSYCCWTPIRTGLTTDQAAERLARFGPNELPVAGGSSLLVRILRQFHHPLIYILLAAGVITAVLGEFVDSSAIFGVVGERHRRLHPESKAEAALEGLRSMVHRCQWCDGHEQRVPSEDLVPGDLVLLEAGDKVPADLRLVRDAELSVNESALTGESVPAHKTEAVLAEGTIVADRTNMVYSGTLVTSGSAGRRGGDRRGHRTRCDSPTVGAADVLATPLTANFPVQQGPHRGDPRPGGADLHRRTASPAGSGRHLHRSHRPWRSAPFRGTSGRCHHHAGHRGVPNGQAPRVIRRLPAVETLGGTTTVICTDKTGTSPRTR